MFATMHLRWAEDPRVLEFINCFDDAKTNATRASFPITDDCLAAMATSALLSANSFPHDRLAWDGLVTSAQTWTAWQLKFVPLHSAMEIELRASYQWGNSFGSANLAMAAHEISTELPTPPPTS